MTESVIGMRDKENLIPRTTKVQISNESMLFQTRSMKLIREGNIQTDYMRVIHIEKTEGHKMCINPRYYMYVLKPNTYVSKNMHLFYRK